MMNKSEITLSEILEFVASKLQQILDCDDIPSDLSLYELGLDSLASAEITFALFDRWPQLEETEPPLHVETLREPTLAAFTEEVAVRLRLDGTNVDYPHASTI